MKRRTFCAAAMAAPVALAGASLCGCHTSVGMDAFVMPDTLDTTTEREISFWAKNDTNKTQTEIYQSAIEGFEACYPNVTVNLRLYTSYDDIYNDVITNISTNTLPNVCITYPDHIATYLTGNNIVVPLDDLISDEQYGLGGSEVAFDGPTSDEVVSKFLEECRISDVLYALPYMRSTEACYVNKTYVEKLGYELPDEIDWDYIWEVSEAALEKNDDGTYAVNDQNVLIPFIYKSTDNMMIQMLAQLDAPYSTDDGQILMFDDTTQELLEVIGEHGQTKAFSTFEISSYPANFLDAGQCLFAIDSTAGSTWMGSDAPLSDISEDAFVEFETAVLPIPQFDTSAPQMISQGPSVCIFNKTDPQDVLTSWLFAQYLLTNDVQIPYAETEGYVPVTTKAQESDEYLDYLSRAGEDTDDHYEIKILATQLLLDHTDDSFVTPVFNGSASLRSAAGELVEDTVKAARRGEELDDDFFQDLYYDVRQLYRLNQGGVSAGRQELGDMPTTGKALLGALGVTWLGIGAYMLHEYLRDHRKEDPDKKHTRKAKPAHSTG